jgi:hypothetical protein
MRRMAAVMCVRRIGEERKQRQQRGNNYADMEHSLHGMVHVAIIMGSLLFWRAGFIR